MQKFVDTNDPQDVPAVTSGKYTTEFWLTVVAITVSAVIGSGILPSESIWIKLLGVLGTVLAALGYVGGRAVVKNAQIKAAVEQNKSVAGMEIAKMQSAANTDIAKIQMEMKASQPKV